MKLPPDPSAFTDSDAIVQALEDGLRHAPLSGPKKRIVKEITDWAVSVGIDPEDPGLLEAYNDAAVRAPQDSRALLARYAKVDLARRALIGLLGRTGAGDQARVLALEALEGNVEPSDISELARLGLRQRPTVLQRVLEVLAASGSGEAVFALRKVYGRRGDEHGQRALELAEAMASDLLEGSALSSALSGEAESVPGGLEGREVLYCAMSLSAEDQRTLARGTAGKALLELLAQPALEMDGELQELSRGSGSLHEYQARVRDELHEITLVTGTPDDDDLRKRAVENLFRREDLDDVADLAPHLSTDVVRVYISRALTKTNRRGARVDRAELSLRLLVDVAPQLRGDFHEIAVACLDESVDTLRAGAVRVVAADHAQLAPPLRAKLSQTYDELPAGMQAALASDVAGAITDQPEVSLESFLRVIASARDDQVDKHLSRLLDRWAGQTATTPDDVIQILAVVGELLARLPSDLRERRISDLLETAATWLRTQGRHIVEPSRALLSWQRFRELLVEHFSVFAERLPAENARRLLSEALRPYEEASPEALMRVASLRLEAEPQERIIEPVVSEAVVENPESADVAFEIADPATRRSLVLAALAAERLTKDRLSRHERALAAGETEALVTQRDTILLALDEAEQAGAGNERLIELFRDVRTVIAGFAPGDEDESVEPSPAVRDWRAAAANRYPGVVSTSNAGGLAPTEVLVEHESELGDLLTELDRRANSARAAPVADRPHYRQDLKELVRRMVEQGLVDAALIDRKSPLALILERGQPSLRTATWNEWARRSNGEPALDLATALRLPETDEQALFIAEATIIRSSPQDLKSAMADLTDEGLTAAWARTRRLLDLDVRRLEELDRQSKRQEVEVGEKVADRLDLSFRVIEHFMFSYFRLRQRLASAGWRQVEDTLGREKRRDQLSPDDHELVDGKDADSFVVKSLGIRFKGKTLRKAVVEGLKQEEASDADEEESESLP